MSELQPQHSTEKTDQAKRLLLNKEAWHKTLDEEVAKALRSDLPLSVVFVDVNYFKDINDELGHDIGDRVIADMREMVSGVVLANLRISSQDDTNQPRDLVTEGVSATPWTDNYEVSGLEAGHIGGDEFAVICRTDQAGAEALGGRLRKALASYVERPENSRLKDLGVSLAIGIGSLKPGITSSSLLREADQAMYEDKINQLPNLSTSQKRALRLSRWMLESSGIRLRDVPKYWRVLD